MIQLFDLHCDTLYELYRKQLSFKSSSLHISSEKIRNFKPYIQVCAVWSDFRLTDEDAYKSYKKCLEYSKKIGFDFSCTIDSDSFNSFILAVEDARLLNSSIERLDTLFNDGVRSLTLNWRGASCIGGGWDTSLPLSPFGIKVVNACCDKGIAVDLSHSSYETQKQVVNMAHKLGFSPIYSHSNSFAVCKHKRNVTDELAKEITNLKGLIGLSLCPEHLSSNKATLYSLVSHILHFLELGCEESIALGCDFDGIPSTPLGINHIEDLSKLHAILLNELGPEVASRIFYKNSYKYYSKLLEGR